MLESFKRNTKSWLSLLIILLLITISVVFYKQHQRLKQQAQTISSMGGTYLEEERMDAENFTFLINSLTVPKAPQDPSKTIERLLETAVRGTALQTYGYLPLNNPNYGQLLNGFWNSSVQYLSYLNTQLKPGSSLTPEDIQALVTMQKYSSIASSQLNSLIHKTGGEVIYKNQALLQETFKKMDAAFKPLPAIGASDSKYQTYQTTSRPKPPSLGNQQLFTNEPFWQKKHLIQKAQTFMQPLWTKSDQKEVSMMGQGDERIIGKYDDFTAVDHNKKITSNYQVSVSQHGGHILRIDYLRTNKKMDPPTGKLSKIQARAFAEKLLANWDENPLTFDSLTEPQSGVYRMTFVPKVKNVLLLNRAVTITYDNNKGRLQTFDTSSYFINSNKKVPTTAKLTFKGAASFLSNQVKPISQPQFCVIYGKSGPNVLTYRFQVKSKLPVHTVFVNAVTGRIEKVN